jgi:hypothetical protein
VRAANPKAAEMDSRLHPNAPLRGFKKMLKVNTSSEPKPTIALKNRPNLCYRNLLQTPCKLLRFMTTGEYGLSGLPEVSYTLYNNRDIVLPAD